MLEDRSARAWKARMAQESPGLPHIYIGLSPLSAGELLLREGDMEAVWDADEWGKLRLGITATVTAAGGGGARNCIFCGQAGGGLGHVAASCPRTAGARHAYLKTISAARRQELEKAGDGTWQLCVFSVEADVSDLGAAVRFGATIGRLLAETVGRRNEEGQEDQRSGQVIVVDS